jgi:Gnt-I system high-affinity gluconate transporter
VVGIPTVIIAGPLFSRTLRRIHTDLPKTFQPSTVADDKLPGLWNSIISSLLPVILLALTTLLRPYLSDAGFLSKGFVFLSNPDMVLLISLAIATYTLGLRMGMGMKQIMAIYGDAVKDIAMILLIMSGAGALKQVLMDSGVSDEIGAMLSSLDMHPLILGWAIACVIRVCVGSATVAGLTAAGIIMPLMGRPDVNPNLMVLAIGAGSLMFSHVNDGGFWLFKEYFNLSIKDTLRSWSVMETIVAVVGIIGVMILDAFI